MQPRRGGVDALELQGVLAADCSPGVPGGTLAVDKCFLCCRGTTGGVPCILTGRCCDGSWCTLSWCSCSATVFCKSGADTDLHA